MFLHPLEQGEGFLLRWIRIVVHIVESVNWQVTDIVTAEKLPISPS
jgi:hypothetical protein